MHVFVEQMRKFYLVYSPILKASTWFVYRVGIFIKQIEFDLNIEEILEKWESKHAVREIIANALDEQQLTSTDSLKIYNNSINSCIKQTKITE